MAWTDRINPQVHLVWSGSWPAGTVEPPRRLVDHELVVVGKGRCRVEIAGQAHELAAGGFVIVPPATLHHTLALAGGCTRHCLHFDWDWSGDEPAGPLFGFVSGRQPIAAPRSAPAWVPATTRSGNGGPAAVAVAQRLVLRWRADERAAARALALELLLTLFAPAHVPGAVDRVGELARRVKACLDAADPESSIRDELRRLGSSYEHLCRCFTRTYGIPPLKYVTLAKIERAKALLRERGATVAAVAKALGYRDPGHFSRVFRAATGDLPRVWLV